MLLAATPQHEMLMTIVTAIAAGVMLIVVARRLDVPAIVILLFGGVLLGPEFIGLVQPEGLGRGLLVIVSLAVGLILFEGGLTLDLSGYRSASSMIRRLLTLGVLITWFGTTLAVRFLADQPWNLAVIAGALVIVTGPTVIAPLLKRVKIHPRLHNILHWEGVLIDPIGVFISILCFEWLIEQGGQAALTNLLIRLGSGLGIGILGGWLISATVKRKLVPTEVVNVFALGGAVVVFGAAEAVRPEAGLLAVTVAGFVFGVTSTAKIRPIRQFKAELTDLLIGTLFILLAARLSIEQFRTFGVSGYLAVAAVIVIIRPLSIFVCSWGVDLTNRERGFLSWVAPRGIVAASMASLVAISVEDIGHIENPRFVETFTYSVIVTTIILQGSTANWLARLLGVQRPAPKGWVLVGAHALARQIALFLRNADVQVVLVDTNAREIRAARDMGLAAFVADARDLALADRAELQGVGYLLALTDNEDLNVRLCQNWTTVLGSDRTFRCHPGEGDPVTAEDEADTAGQIVWPRLPKPSLIAAELSRGEATVLEAEGVEPAYAQLATPIVTVSGSTVSFQGPAAGEGNADASRASRTLYLQRRADYLVRSLRPELIGVAHAADRPELLRRLVDRVVELYPSLPREEMVAELLERETTFPTALGHGVALPHAYSNALDRRICAIAQVPEGVDFSASDGEPVRLVFLLLSPQGDPEGHLATLADIARLVIDDDVRERLMNATSPLETIRIIRESGA